MIIVLFTPAYNCLFTAIICVFLCILLGLYQGVLAEYVKYEMYFIIINRKGLNPLNCMYYIWLCLIFSRALDHI